MRHLLLLLSIGFLGQTAHARKFDLDKQTVAAYFKGSFGTSAIQQDAFAGSSGIIDTVQEKVRYQYGGEFGMFLLLKKVGVRLGVEGVYPQKLDAVEAKNPLDMLDYNLTSTVVGVFPVIHLEYSPILDAQKRVYLSGGVGAGTVTIHNSYAFTSVGNATYSLIDFDEEARANVLMYEAAGGFEFSMVDNVTCFFDAGYRMAKATDFKHQRAANTFLGPVAKGDTARNIDGSKRKLNMDSTFVGVGFKFYVNF